jgi:hypothetical protein
MNSEKNQPFKEEAYKSKMSWQIRRRDADAPGKGMVVWLSEVDNDLDDEVGERKGKKARSAE